MRFLPFAARSALFIALSLLTVVTVPASGYAQEEGRQLFEVGVSAYSRGNYAEALVAFEAAFAADGVPGVLYNIAMCQQALGRVPDSVNSFRRYLELDGENLAQEDLDDVAEQIRGLRDRFGDLVIRLDVDGTTVIVDDHLLGSSPIPGPVALAPGTHRVLVRHDELGRTDESTVVVVAGESVTVELSLAEEEPEIVSPPVEPPPVVEPLETPEQRLGWWFWSSVALSGAAMLGAVVTGALMLGQRGDYIDSEHLDLDAYDTAHSLAQGTDALIGVAAGMAAIAVVSLIIHYVRRRREAEVEPSVARRSPTRELGWVR